MNLVQTPVQVKLLSLATVDILKAGSAITQGMPVYKDADEAYHPAAATSALAANASGFALSPALAGEYFARVRAGSIDVGADLVIGTVYVVSNTAGAIAPIGDVASGWWLTILGIAKTARELVIGFSYSPVVTP